MLQAATTPATVSVPLLDPELVCIPSTALRMEGTTPSTATVAISTQAHVVLDSAVMRQVVNVTIVPWDNTTVTEVVPTTTAVTVKTTVPSMLGRAIRIVVAQRVLVRTVVV